MSIRAVLRCRPTISRQCCATASTRRPRPPGRWRGLRRRWGRTSPLICLRRPVTSRPAWWSGLWTSCGGAGSCASSVTATTSPTTAPRNGVRASQPAEALAAAPAHRARLWSCCTPMTRTWSRLSSRSSMRGAGGLGGRWPITGALLTSQRACSPMPRRSGCTRRHCRSCGPACGQRPGPAGARRP